MGHPRGQKPAAEPKRLKPGRKGLQLNFRVQEHIKEKLDYLAAIAGLDRSTVFRDLVTREWKNVRRRKEGADTAPKHTTGVHDNE